MRISGAPGNSAHALCTRRAFTLIEIMLVVAILGIVMATGIPSLLSASRKEGMRKAVADTVAACEKARALAIMSGTTAEVHFHPQEGTISVQGGSAPASAVGDDGAAPVQTPASAQAAVVKAASGFSGKLPENIAFEMLDINLVEHNGSEDAVVRFFPDGRCDELVAVLLSDKNERTAITLEITTGLPTIYDDPRKLLMK